MSLSRYASIGLATFALSTAACGAPEMAAEEPPAAASSSALLTEQQGQSIVIYVNGVYSVVTSVPSRHVVYLRVGINAPTTILAGRLDTPGNVDGIGGAARFNRPAGVGYDADLNVVYVADLGNRAVRRISLGNSRVITTMSQSTAMSLAASSGYPITGWYVPGVAVQRDRSGTLYMTDAQNNTIWQYLGGVMRPLAGQPGTAGYVDATGTAARFNGLDGASVFAVPGGFFGPYFLQVRDEGNGVLRRITLPGGVVSTAGPLPP